MRHIHGRLKHALASVPVLLLVTGCDSAPDSGSEQPGDPTLTTEWTNSPGVQAITVNGFPGANSGTSSGTGWVDPGTLTGGQGSSDGQGGSGGESGSDGEHGVAGEAGAPNYPENPHPALVMTRAQWQTLLDEQSNPTTVSTGGLVQEDPEDLWVVVGDTAMVCNELPPFPACGGHWQVSFVLTRAMQQGGTFEPEWFGSSFSTEVEDPNMPDICGGGGGGGPSHGNIIEVLALDASEIRFRLHSNPGFIDDDINGIYTVPLCPQ